MLTNRLNEDHNYELPEGYGAFGVEVEKDLTNNQTNESEWIVSSILNDMFESNLGIVLDIKEIDN